jgi:long-chain acyl-CoA synthetase
MIIRGFTLEGKFKGKFSMNNLSVFLRHSAHRYGSRPALLSKTGSRTQTWTYTDLLDQSLDTAAWLQQQGVKKGDRVILWAANSPWWVTAYFGALHLGAILVPLDMQAGKDFIHNVAAQTEPVLALLSEKNLSGWSEPVRAYNIKVLENLADGNFTAPDPPVLPDDLAEIMFTSGTTGNPKGVLLTHHNILSNVESVNGLVPYVKDYRLLSLLPLSHMFEQTVGLLQPLNQGASIFYPANIQASTLFQATQEQQITTILMVPQVLELFMSSIEREVKKKGKEKSWQRLQQVAGYLPIPARRLLFRPVLKRLGGHIKFFAVGGAYLNPKLIRKWERLGIPIMQGYGLTECSPILTGYPFNRRKPNSVGKAIAGVQVKLAQDGEILAKGPNITLGYWHNPGATSDAFDEEGWFKTGDLGIMDREGYLFLRSRKKDMIVLANGKNVYPEDLERILREMPGIKDAVVIADPAAKDPQVHAVLISELSVKELDLIIQQANLKLEPHQKIRGYSLWPDQEFPITHTMKIKKHEVIRAIKELAARP